MARTDDDADPVLLRSARVADAFHAAAFWFVGAVVLLSPVFFASTEPWWFWPMAALLSFGCLFCGAATLVESSFLRAGDSPVHRRRIPARAFVAWGACAPFLVYAFVRAQFPSAPGFPLVERETTRSLLLFFTPVAISLVVVLSGRRRGRARLLRLFLLEAFVLSAYGLWNLFHSNDANVLWVVPDDFYDFTYAGRLSSTFFCPNNFSGWLDVAICVLLGGALAPARLRGAGTSSGRVPSLPHDGRPDPVRAAFACDDACVVLQSSGTTGAPKAVVLTQAGVLADMVAGLRLYDGQSRG